MTPAQKRLRELRDRQSRERQRMAELSQADQLTDETRAELDAIETGTPDLERQIRAAVVSLDDEERAAEEEAKAEPDSEMRERVELRSKAMLVNYLLAASKGRVVGGAEAELCAAAKVQGIPIELWDVPRETRSQDGEQRAVTPAPSIVGVNFSPIHPAVFAASIAPRLGIDMPRVASGTFATGTITTSQTVAAKTKGDAAVASAGAITVQTATPKRISARLEFRIEDIAAIGAENFESVFRDNLALALSAELDNQAINGNGTAPNLQGFMGRLTDPTDPSNVAAFDDFVAAFSGGIDGLWASTEKEIGMVVGVDTFRLAAKAFRDSTGGGDTKRGDDPFSTFAMAHYGGFWTNSRMPSGSIEPAILYRMGRPGMRRAVCPHWGSVDIDDIYSGAASGTRAFNMHVLLGDVILTQPDAYTRVDFKVS